MFYPRRIGVAIDAPDFLDMARALGCEAQRVESLADLARALEEAHRRRRPTVLELPEQAFLATPAGNWY